MGRRKQIVPKKTDNLEDQSTSDKNDEGSGAVDSDGGSESADDQEVTMPTLETLEHNSTSSVPPSVVPAEKSMSAPLDLLKNPFLLPAQLLALNPNLYAAQFAQLQAAQLMLAKQTAEEGSAAASAANAAAAASDPSDRKRSAAEESPLDLGSKAKYPRSSSPVDKEPSVESPLDLSGSKSPDMKREQNAFNPLLPPNILSFFNQLKPPVAASSEFSSLLTLAASKSSTGPAASPPRSSPWQSQWLNKNSDGGKIGDVFKCVWCKESYQTLEELTTHMKDAKHHSMPYPLSATAPIRPMSTSVSSPTRSPISVSSPISSASTSPKPSQQVRDILKEQLPLPRKLVRGQDVWIGKADQQTRDILKCMGCGQSFRSLDLLTKHMQETQHYKKVISHDQLSAWKYPESQHAPKNHINSVLTCKVCEKAFGSLKDLSEHMIKANHYTGENRHAPRPPLPSPAAALAKERKKALPVKKLLELERARHEVIGGPLGSRAAAASARDIMETGKLLCERCEDRIPLEMFITHIQQCIGKNVSVPPGASAVKVEDPSVVEGADKKPELEQKKDCNSSILGSLEQMVKGNFQSSAMSPAAGAKRFSMSSPPTTLSALYSPVSSLSKFSVSNMIPKDSPQSPASSASVSSKPSSPMSNPSGPTTQTVESPGTGQTNGKIKQEIDGNNQTDGSAASPAPSQNGSPSPFEVADNPALKRMDSSPTPAARIEVKTEKGEPLSPPSVGQQQDKKSDNPLAALQMLCDTQRKTPKNPKISENSPISDPGAMMAFSWACNQAVSSDSAIKCPFCDTPFISKGAYRHHLSKMHFTKDPGALANLGTRSPSPDTKEDETIQSKYAKYSQLAKQLSCNQK